MGMRIVLPMTTMAMESLMKTLLVGILTATEWMTVGRLQTASMLLLLPTQTGQTVTLTVMV